MSGNPTAEFQSKLQKLTDNKHGFQSIHLLNQPNPQIEYDKNNKKLTISNQFFDNLYIFIAQNEQLMAKQLQINMQSVQKYFISSNKDLVIFEPLIVSNIGALINSDILYTKLLSQFTKMSKQIKYQSIKIQVFHFKNKQMFQDDQEVMLDNFYTLESDISKQPCEQLSTDKELINIEYVIKNKIIKIIADNLCFAVYISIVFQRIVNKIPITTRIHVISPILKEDELFLEFLKENMIDLVKHRALVSQQSMHYIDDHEFLRFYLYNINQTIQDYDSIDIFKQINVTETSGYWFSRMPFIQYSTPFQKLFFFCILQRDKAMFSTAILSQKEQANDLMECTKTQNSQDIYLTQTIQARKVLNGAQLKQKQFEEKGTITEEITYQLQAQQMIPENQDNHEGMYMLQRIDDTIKEGNIKINDKENTKKKNAEQILKEKQTLQYQNQAMLELENYNIKKQVKEQQQAIQQQKEYQVQMQVYTLEQDIINLKHIIQQDRITQEICQLQLQSKQYNNQIKSLEQQVNIAQDQIRIKQASIKHLRDKFELFFHKNSKVQQQLESFRQHLILKNVK